MLRTLHLLGACFLGMTICLSALADDNPDGPDFDQIRAEQVVLREQAAAGKDIFEDISADTRDALVARQNQLLGLLEGKSSLEELSSKEQVTAFNLLQSINETVNVVEEDKRVRCTLQSKTGSHRKLKVCKSLAQRKEDQEASQTMLRSMQRGNGLPANP